MNKNPDLSSTHSLPFQPSSPNDLVPRNKFSPLTLVGLAFAILNSWTAACAAINLALATGGPVAVVYGLLVGTIFASTIALSLAELCHIFPTSGGQYHWAYTMTPPKWRRGVAYTAGWLGVAGWTALAASAPLYAGSTVVGLIGIYHPEHRPGI